MWNRIKRYINSLGRKSGEMVLVSPGHEGRYVAQRFPGDKVVASGFTASEAYRRAVEMGVLVTLVSWSPDEMYDNGLKMPIEPI